MDPSRQQYDRIYCGAGVPEANLRSVLACLSDGGVAVVPVAERVRLAAWGVRKGVRGRVYGRVCMEGCARKGVR